MASLQEQVAILQQQVTYLFYNIQHSSIPQPPKPESPQKSLNPFLCDTLSLPQKTFIETGVQCTICEPTYQRPPSDKTFFNQVLGQVNQILENTTGDNSNKTSSKTFDPNTYKYIHDSDLSQLSLHAENNHQPSSVDKSAYVDALAAKYLDNSSQKHHEGSKTSADIDVSTTCYNYLRKYGLLDHYKEENDSSDKKYSNRMKLL